MQNNLKMTNLNLIFGLLILALLSSCRGEAIVFDGANPIHLTEDLIINERDSLIINAGAKVVLDTGVNIIAYGVVRIKGTEEKPVTIKGSDSDLGWGKLWAKGECKELTIEHAIIENGQIMSYDTKNYFNHVQFKTHKQLKWDDAIARFWYGSVLIENGRIDGVNKGEGFLLHNVEKPIVRKNAFTKIPDAVEYINCNDGQILDNVFLYMKDDAIDQNSCKRTLIKGNQIFYVKDCGMELGSENFGSSESLQVVNNLIIGCPKGIVLKESSTAHFEQLTFYDNQIAVEILTPTDSARSSKATINRSVFIKNFENFRTEGNSVASFEQCLSDSIGLAGTTNLVGKINFENFEKHQYNLLIDDFSSDVKVDSFGYRKD